MARTYAGDHLMGAPLIKWPGGKRALLKYLLPLVPKTFHSYYEPFLGGAALFFALQPANAVLSDKNEELMNCYIQVRDRPDAVIARLALMQNTEEDYYAIRGCNPSEEVARAARIIYLTALSFNGIHRVNRQGKFNVPYGHKYHLQPCDPAKIYAASSALSNAQLLDEDFEKVIAPARAGDFVYLDPPYTVAHGNNGFLKYNAKIFSWKDQLRLARVANELSQRGCFVIISNADYPLIRELYTEFRVETIIRPSIISASGKYRRAITECIFYNGIYKEERKD